MPTPRIRRRSLKPDRVRALELLDGCGDEGCTEGILRANGFSISDMVELVRAKLVTAVASIVAGSRRMEVARGRITDAGRRALAE
jgi:hypothetical protein